MNWKIYGSNAAFLLLGSTIVVLSFFIGDTTTIRVLTLAIVILGFAIGWVIGVLISPYNKTETERFTVLTKAVGVFASGYLVGKVDKLIEQIFQPSFILDSLNGFRFIAFLSAFLLSMLLTFVNRTYAMPLPPK